MDRYLRFLIVASVIFTVILSGAGKAPNAVVIDSVSGTPLPMATVCDRFGIEIGYSKRDGRLPDISESSYPITVRYLGYKENRVRFPYADSIFMQEDVKELPEFVLESPGRKFLHLLAYVREYSTLTTYTDTVFLFREKLVDFMLGGDGKSRFRGWSQPRVLACQSYYRFTDCNGLDSVSDSSDHHFSWSDWIGMPPEMALPPALRTIENKVDTLYGKYSATEIWNKTGDRVSVEVDVLADTVSRKWVPDLYGFFHRDSSLERSLEFERLRLRFDYDNVVTNSLEPENLTFYTYNVESAGRGHGMFRFNRVGQQFFVNTTAEVYIMDREYLSLKEARKWDKRILDLDDKTIIEPLDAPEPDASVLALIERVENLDKEQIRLDAPPDYKLAGADLSRKNFRIGRRALFMLKQLTGISAYKSRKKLNNRWKAFRDKQKRRSEE